MDLSFSLKPRGRAGHYAANLADIKAEADRRRMDNVGQRFASGPLRGEKIGRNTDLVHILACCIILNRSDSGDAAMLGGSFNPHVALQLMVGNKGECDVHPAALADVNGQGCMGGSTQYFKDRHRAVD